MAAVTTSLAIAAIAGSTIAKAGSAYSQAEALKAQGNYQRNIANQNAQMADLNAEDAVARGSKAAARVRREARQAIGSQKVSYAGQGVTVGSGSSADLEDETLSIAADDVITIKNNAFRQAFGYMSEASQYRYKGRMAARAGRAGARSVLVSGVTDVFNGVLSGASTYEANKNRKTAGVE